MKKLILLVASIALIIGCAAARSQSTDERELVRQAVLDYVEGVYQVEPARIERSVHPTLSKQGYWREKGKDGYIRRPSGAGPGNPSARRRIA